MSLDVLNTMSADEARTALARCCGASRWVDAMLASRPFASVQELLKRSRQADATLGKEDWLEAFAHHPRIGDLDALRQKFKGTLAEGEQAGAREASDETLKALAQGNVAYEKRFGHTFIVSASGKSADEMLALLQERLKNEGRVELRTAAAEQSKITERRLRKLVGAE
jgi:2-oxo-4-hydroxy-4-carboxy-5-ureidoimidazoline decarboxylase